MSADNKFGDDGVVALLQALVPSATSLVIANFSGMFSSSSANIEYSMTCFQLSQTAMYSSVYSMLVFTYPPTCMPQWCCVWQAYNSRMHPDWQSDWIGSITAEAFQIPCRPLFIWFVWQVTLMLNIFILSSHSPVIAIEISTRFLLQFHPCLTPALLSSVTPWCLLSTCRYCCLKRSLLVDLSHVLRR